MCKLSIGARGEVSSGESQWPANLVIHCSLSTYIRENVNINIALDHVTLLMHDHTLSLVFYCTLFSSSSLNASRLPTLVSDIQMTWMNISEASQFGGGNNVERRTNPQPKGTDMISNRPKRPPDTNMPSVPRDKQEPSSSSILREGGSYEQGQMNRELSPEPGIS